MKSILRLSVAVAMLAGVQCVHAQGQMPTSGYNPMTLGPLVQTASDAATQTKQAMVSAQINLLSNLEVGFDTNSRLVTSNPLFLTPDQVVAGFGTDFNNEVLTSGQLALSTIIKQSKAIAPYSSAATSRAQTQYATSVAWLAQPRIVTWLATYKLDPSTGEPLAP